MFPYLLGNQSLAVVAPDYAGLKVSSFANGTKIHHPWVTSPAQANDMAYALSAARAAFPQYLRPEGSFLAMGHSQGGRATWGFAERQAVDPVAGYRGTVLIAPAGSPLDIENAAKNPAVPWAFPAAALQSLTIGAVNAVYPSYKLAGLTDQALDIYKNAFEHYEVCLPTSNLPFGPILANITKPGWQNAPEVEAWDDLTRVGNKRFAGPVLLIAGDANGSDGIIPYDGPYSSALLTTIHDLCHLMDEGEWKQSLEVVGFKNATHFPLIQASENSWLDWIKRRLSNAAPAPPSGCSIGSVEAFRGGRDAVQLLSPNFLLTAVNATDIWKTSL